jgi:pilus assembly protein CpaB
MKPKTLILLMVAIGCGLVAAFLASQATGKGQVSTVPIVVTKAEVRQGTFVTDSNADSLFEMKEWQREAVPPNSITDIKELKKKLVQRTLDPGAPVNKRDVADSEGLSKTLSAGQRAVTVRVTVDSAVAGFILPGSHVDLIANMADTKEPQKIMSKIFLQNVLVLAVNTDDAKPENSKVVQQPGLVTLALTPEDAEKAIRVSKDGIPYMVLRRPDDEKHVKTTGALTAFGRSNSDSEAVDNKKVLVARGSINEGTLIDDVEKYFDTTEIPANLVPPAAISDPATVKGKKVEKFLGAKMPLTEEYLIAARIAPKEDRKVPQQPKAHVMKIYQGASRQDHPVTLDGGEAISTGTPVGPRPKDGGSEGK